MRIENVLIVEDDKDTANFVTNALGELSCKTDSVGNLGKAREMLVQGHHDLVFLDIHLPDGEGIELLREPRVGGNSPTFIVMSGSATFETAVEAMRLGAVDYLLKPFNISQLEIALRRAESWGRLRAENAYLRGDIDLLVDYFIQAFSKKYEKPLPLLSPEAQEVLRAAPWPGNVRELQNCIERAVILADPSREIAATDFRLAERMIGAENDAPVEREEDLSLDRMEKKMVEKALQRTRGQVSQAAELLGISVRALHYKRAKERSK